jgi:hypothetical protein
VVERIDELTGLPTTRTGSPEERAARRKQFLLDSRWRKLTLSCPECGGTWTVYEQNPDSSRPADYDQWVFVHERAGQPSREWAFDAWAVKQDREFQAPDRTAMFSKVVNKLRATEAHPANAPTPGKAGRR